ncbi:MAG: hypothetical protein U0176_11965 [Bacteroidia bacterium]
MSFVECEFHGGDVGVMVSAGIWDSMIRGDAFNSSSRVCLVGVPLFPDVRIPFYAFEHEFPEIEGMKEENKTEEELEEKWRILELVVPSCNRYFDLRFGNRMRGGFDAKIVIFGVAFGAVDLLGFGVRNVDHQETNDLIWKKMTVCSCLKE